jgi:hydrogenase nickel incorporation protein HypB
MKKIVTVKRKALAANDEVASVLRRQFKEHQTLVVNLISSPGSGKTALLEATAQAFSTDDSRTKMAVIEGDVATENDADRIRAQGVSAHQILTGGACHLDARQIASALEKTTLLPTDILFIENVGNLICPTTYDLGEDFKVALLSTTEGDDKPVKYPAIFSRADVIVLTKIDLLPYVPFDVDQVRSHLQTLNPSATLVCLSSTTGEGIDEWCDLLHRRLSSKRQT